MLCSVCNQLFSCNASSEHCWCMDYPFVLTTSGLNSCMCESCLKEHIKVEIDAYVSSITPQNASENKAKNLPKSLSIKEGIDYYMEDGLYVFTTWFHLKRGECCKNGCKHCPYGFEKK